MRNVGNAANGYHGKVIDTGLPAGAGGMEHVADSPYPVRVIPAKPCPEKAYVHGPGRSQAVVGEAARFEIEARDSFGNRCFGDGLAEDLRLDVHLEGPGGRQLPVEIASTRDGRLLCSYTPDAEGYYRLHVEHGGRALRGTPYSVHVLSVEEAAARQENEQALAVVHEDEGDHEGPGENEVSEGCMEGAGRATKAAGAAIPDTMRLWEQIAAAAYAADGVTDGWDSEEEGKKETEEEAYMRKHPNVPVVENLEDLWLVSKLQQERKAKEEKEKAAKLEKLKSQLESAYGVGQAPTQEEVQEALKDILAAERAGGSEKVEAPGAVDTERSSKYPVQVVRRPKKEELVAAAALLDDLA